MRFNNTLTRAMIAAASFFVLACQGLESPETQEHKIVASVGAYNTKANFHTTETLNVTCDWNGRETLRVYYKKSDGKYHSIFANSRIAKLEEGGKSADFTYSPEPEWGLDGKDQSYQVAVFTVNCAPTIDPADGSIYLDARLIRQPLKDFELPVYYVGEVVNGTVEATFSHYYAYEFLHVKNTSDKTIEFSLNGYETPWIWYKKLASVGLEDGVVYNKSWSGLTPAEVSYPVSIAPGSSDIIVSAYIPNDFIVKDAAIVATIDGNIVTSTNKKSSAAPLVPGRAYHMYAGWNGQELRFWDDGEEPLDVRTLTASIDPQYLSGEFTGVVANPPMSEIKTGFRFWKENNPEDYVEYDSTSSDNGSFSLNLKYDDFVYIANESPVEGKYFVSAFAIDAKGTRHPGNVLEFTIESGQPAVPVIPEAVDLGLSVKWASFNVGATKPEAYGGHYAWGEIEEKDAYDWSTYKWSEGASNKLTKYNIHSVDGIIDGKTELEKEDDVAYVKLGHNWRMPTKDEQDELLQKCSWKWTLQNGISGYVVTGPNGKSIFLPTASARDDSSHGGTDSVLSGHYWSSSLSDEMTSIDSYYLFLDSNGHLQSTTARYRGLSVRPVYDDSEQKPEIIIPEPIDLGLPSGMKWASFNLGASKPEEYGDYYAWAETDPKATYTYDTYKWSNGSKLTKYNWDSSSGYSGFVDNKEVLDIEDDAAHVILGGNWRIPSKEEIEELITCCSGIWTTLNDIGGYKLTGPNGNSIFLPASGYKYVSSIEAAGIIGDYHSSTLLDYDVWHDYTMFFNSNQGIAGGDGGSRDLGKTIRPVYADSSSPEIEVTPTDIDFETVEYETTKTRPFTVKNTGNGILSFSISCVCHDNVFEVNDGGATYSLASGASQEFMVTAHGMKRNSKASCDIRVIPSFGDGTKTVNVKAEGWDNKPLTLETPAKTIRVGEEDRVNILFGSLDYGISNDNPTIVDAIISTQGIGGGGWYDSWQSTYKYVNLKALATGTATIKVTDKERGEEATIQVTVSGGIATPEAIDLGLPSGLKWASFNLGASKPEEYGDYYAWGETEPYYSSLDPLAWKPGKESGYTWSSYRWSVDGYSLYSLIKYCTNPDYNDEGFTDGKTVLEPDDDAAHVNLGGGWRMPTREEYDELIKECTWEKTTVDGISVRKITGPSGKYILLPVAGSWNGTGLGGLNSYGYYWSSSVDAQDPGNAYCICIMSNSVSESRNSRCGGFPVRPVCD